MMHRRPWVAPVAVSLLPLLGCPLPEVTPPATSELATESEPTATETSPGTTMDVPTGVSGITTSEGPDGTTTSTTADTNATTTDTEGVPDIDLPKPNSMLAIFEDPQGSRLPDVWVQPLPLEDAIPLHKPDEDGWPEPYHADSAGRVLAEGLPAGRQRWIIGAPGFSTRTVQFTLEGDIHANQTFRMTPIGATFQFNTVDGASLTHKNVMVTLPPGNLVKKRTGEQVKGMVKAEVTVIEPGVNNLDAPPVRMVGLTDDQQEPYIESFGMVGVELSTMDGEQLQLREEMLASVTFDIPEELSQEIEKRGLTTIPAWHTDPTLGDMTWTQIGDFALKKNGQGTYVGTLFGVEKFSWINMDVKVEDPHCYIIKVIDALTQLPVPNHFVSIEDNPWENVDDVTDPDGTVCFELKSNMSVNVVPDNLTPFNVTSLETDPISVCADNPSNYYINHPKGICTVYEVEINSDKECVPGSTWDCSNELPYEWPEMTKDVGICKTAHRMCEDGTGWSVCHPPQGPEQETCPDGVTQFDEDCDGLVNEKDADSDDNCACNGDPEPKACYLGDPDDVDLMLVPETACMAGAQMCNNFNQWGPCVGGKLPDFSTENCILADKIESCQAKPCDFDPLWSNSIGGFGQQATIAMHLAEEELTAVTEVNAGDTESHGDCFMGGMEFLNNDFTGVTLARYSTKNLYPCKHPNIIHGGLIGTVADASQWGSAVIARASTSVAPDLEGLELGCNVEVPQGRFFVTRFNDENVCIYRAVMSAGMSSLKAVAVGTDPMKYTTYIAGVIAANEQPTLADCNFGVSGQSRGFYAKLRRENGMLKCTVVTNVGETPQSISVSGEKFVAAVKSGNFIEVHLMDLDLMNVWSDTPVELTGGIFTTKSLSVRDDMVALSGFGSGSIELFAQPYALGDTDFALLVVRDPQQTAGTVLIGKGTVGDGQDVGEAVEWVDVIGPFDPQPKPGLVVVGHSQSDNFVFDDCWNNVNPEVGDVRDSFIGLLSYDPIAEALTCEDHHPLVGMGSQTVKSVAVDSVRVAVGGWHNDDIYIAGQLQEPFTGTLQSAFHIVTVNPVQPLQ